MVGLSISNSIDITGQTVLNPIVTPSQLFLERVIDDLGTFEAQQCLDALINQGLFDNANFVLTPNGYKAGKLYALKPENGDLDVTWVRNGNATRVNQNGLIESVGNNVPRLDYLAGNCPSILVEEQSTNLVLNTTNFNNFTTNNNVTFEDLGNFEQRALLPSSNSRLNTVVSGNFLAGEKYFFHFEIKAGNSENIGKTLAFRSQNSGLIILDSLTLTDDFVKHHLEINIDVNRTSLDTRIITFGQTNPADNVIIRGWQLEKNKISSYIPTQSTAVTRPADAPQPITVPAGTTEIVEALEDGTFNTITTIPATYTIPFGRFKYILFNGA